LLESALNEKKNKIKKELKKTTLYFFNIFAWYF